MADLRCFVKRRSFMRSKTVRTIVLVLVLVVCLAMIDPKSIYRNKDSIQIYRYGQSGHWFNGPNTHDQDFNMVTFSSENEEIHNVRPTASIEKPFLIIGISTVCRQKTNFYLKSTIESLLNNTSAQEKLEIKIVVSVSDLNTSCSDFVTSHMKEFFLTYIETGFITLVKVPKLYYPPLHDLKRTFNDSNERVKWRSQQNIDYAYVMQYCHRKSKYYLHIEDDVTSANNFFGKIKAYIDEIKSDWAFLEFSTLGFIGKLFHSEDLQRLAGLLRFYYDQMPCDYLLFVFKDLMLQEKRFIKIPTLFQHHGLLSSMPDLIRNISDRMFYSAKKIHKGDNPSGNITTTLKQFSKFRPEDAYMTSGESFFWAISPKSGESLILKFDKPQHLQRIVIETGFFSPVRDIFKEAILYVSAVNNGDGCSNYKFISEFQKGRVDIDDLPKIFTKSIVCIRILVTENQQDWVVIREIAVYLNKNSNIKLQQQI